MVADFYQQIIYIINCITLYIINNKTSYIL